MSNITFFISQKSKRGFSTVKLRTHFKGQRIITSTKIKINESLWNFRAQKPKLTGSEGYDLKQRLERIEAGVNHSILKGSVNTREDLISLIGELAQDPVETKLSFLGVMRECVDQVGRLSLAQSKKMKTLMNHMIEFERYFNTRITFENIDSSFYDRFLIYYYETDHTTATTGRAVRQFKTFMNWALKREYHSNIKFKEFKTFDLDKEVIFLDLEELMLLKDCDLNSERFQDVRDAFCFACFTGLRYSDIYDLKQAHIKGNEIKKTTIKTSEKDLIIPLVSHAVDIIERRGGSDPVFRKISNQKFNKYIKEICDDAGINQEVIITRHVGQKRSEIKKPKSSFISSHTGRKTFVTLSLQLGVSPHIVMSITGHKQFSTMRKYMKITNKNKSQVLLSAWN